MPPSPTYSGKAVKEFYCDGNGIKSETFECPNGCNDGACIKGKEPYCSAIGTRSEGCLLMVTVMFIEYTTFEVDLV